MSTAVAGALMVLAACGSSGGPRPLAVEAPWARPTPTGATNGVVYLTVHSDLDDQLVGAEVPPGVAARAELHRSTTEDGSAGHHGGGSGAPSISMGEVAGIPIGAGETVRLEPGADHIMLVDVRTPLAAGDTFPLTLRFGTGRTLTTEVTVADNPPP